MDRRHLPAGQPPPVPGGGPEMGGGGNGPLVVGGGAPGFVPQQQGPPAPRRGGGGGGGRHHNNHQPYPNHPYQPMYSNTYGGYGAPYYAMPPHYANGPMPPAPYQPQYSRSPPAMQHYMNMVPNSMGMPPPANNYGRPPQHSPGLQQQMPGLPQQLPSTMNNMYQPPSSFAPPPAIVSSIPAPIPAPPQTPSSTMSGQGPPPPMTPSTPQAREPIVQSLQATPQAPQASRPLVLLPPRDPFRPPVPWLSHPDEPFPHVTRSRRRRRPVAEDVELPFAQAQITTEPDQQPVEEEPAALKAIPTTETALNKPEEQTPRSDAPAAQPTSAPALRSDTPSTQDHRSELGTSTSPTTPSSIQPAHASTTATVTPTKPSRAPIPAVPFIPALPRPPPKDVPQTHKENGDGPLADKEGPEIPDSELEKEPQAAEKAELPAPAPAKSAPKLWAGLFAGSSAAAKAPSTGASSPSTTHAAATNGPAESTDNTTGFISSNVKSLAEALRAYRVGNGEKVVFIEPRGLRNTGNMCYMNSILQVLLFCIPFYDFLDQASRKAAHSFKSDTSLVDAMIMFMRDFAVIDSASSVEQLRRRLKAEELEQFGTPFTPEFIYEAIRKLPRFDGMRRGHQQDAEEFLGFLLESLHEECAHVIRAASGGFQATASAPAPASAPRDNSSESQDGWLEVGPKQRSAVTRSSGQSHVSTPITKIFGGQLRSELRVPGLKDSVTLEPYQPLQLDIQAPHVRNIIDALKGLTRPETLRGDFNSPRGKDVTATKTVYIESLPPVLILHLKRFQFDAEGNGGSTVKIWKKIGYPLELEIPREVFSRQKRNSVLAEGGGLPRYKLITVVYHHGKNASGGHYTVDVRRQDGKEWIRIDDTVIRRVHADDVAEGGAEEKDGARTPDSVGRRDNGGSVTPSAVGNRFSGMGSDNGDGMDDAGDEGEEGGGWKQVSGASSTGGHSKKWSTVVNGGSVAGATAGPAGTTTAPAAKSKAQTTKDNARDDKVAYLLFYQRV